MGGPSQSDCSVCLEILKQRTRTKVSGFIAVTEVDVDGLIVGESG